MLRTTAFCPARVRIPNRHVPARRKTTRDGFCAMRQTRVDADDAVQRNVNPPSVTPTDDAATVRPARHVRNTGAVMRVVATPGPMSLRALTTT